MTTAPRSASIAATVDFPEPIPPVRPIKRTAAHSSERRRFGNATVGRARRLRHPQRVLTSRAHAIRAVAIALVACSAASACTAEGETPGQRTRVFYAAIADGRFDAARDSLVSGAGLRALERRFGSFAAWATRATKNSTVMRTEVLDESV